MVLLHVDVYSGLLARHVDSDFFRRAYLMVDLFFVLSGFVMSHVYSGWFDHGVHRGEARRFIAARIARVYPLHLLTLLYLVGIVIVRYRLDPSAWQPQHEVIYSPAVLPMHVLLLHGMNTTPYCLEQSIVVHQHGVVDLPGVPVPRATLRDAGPLRVSLIAAICLATYFAIMFYLVPLVTVPPAMADDPVGQASTRSASVTKYGFARCAAGSSSGCSRTARMRRDDGEAGSRERRRYSYWRRARRFPCTTDFPIL